MSLFQMEGTSPEIRNRFLEIEQKQILVEMEAEQEASETARKNVRTEHPSAHPSISGPPNDQTATANTLGSLSQVNTAPIEVSIDNNQANIATCAIGIL